MNLQRLRSAATALALAGLLGLAAPAHAARWGGPVAFPGWIESALDWIGRLWIGIEAAESKPPIEKGGIGIGPNGCPPPSQNQDQGIGIDPNG